MLALFLFFLSLAWASVDDNKVYIVLFNDDMDVAELDNHVSALGTQNVVHVYRNLLKGYAATLSPSAYTTVRQHPKFKSIEADQMMYASKISATCSSKAAPSWGLTRISQRKMSLTGTYKYPTDGGNGVTAFIIDTGILITHQDFEGRASFGFKADAKWSSTDANGHGTHVASTIGGYTYGVAKKTTLVAVKVLGDDGSGTNSGVIAGVEWAFNTGTAGGKKAVANMSLGGGYSAALNAAVSAAMKGGLFMVVAAGNEDSDACSGSPSSAHDVITTGATAQSASQTDERSYFSNWGTCVDIFAPGSEITAAWIGSNTATRTISGTSMASPHVCGVSALILGSDPNLNWDDMTKILLDTATPNEIDLDCVTTACKQSPNLMLFNNCA